MLVQRGAEDVKMNLPEDHMSLTLDGLQPDNSIDNTMEDAPIQDEIQREIQLLDLHSRGCDLYICSDVLRCCIFFRRVFMCECVRRLLISLMLCAFLFWPKCLCCVVLYGCLCGCAHCMLVCVRLYVCGWVFVCIAAASVFDGSLLGVFVFNC